MIYPFTHNELKIGKGLVSLLTIEVDDNVDEIQSDLNVSFIPNPLSYESKIAGILVDAKSGQTNLISKETPEEKIQKVKDDYAALLKRYAPIDCPVRTSKYANGEKTKITFFIPYNVVVTLLQSVAFQNNDLAIVFLDDEKDEE